MEITVEEKEMEITIEEKESEKNQSGFTPFSLILTFNTHTDVRVFQDILYSVDMDVVHPLGEIYIDSIYEKIKDK